MSLTAPFEVIHNESRGVRDKFLEGIPYQNNFPGPFQGLTQQQMNEYTRMQQNAVNRYPDIAEEPISVQANMYPGPNDGNPDCSALGGRIPMVPPQNYGPQPGPRYSPGIQLGYSANRMEDFRDDSISDPQSQTGFGQIVPRIIIPPDTLKCSAEDNPLLDIDNRPVDQFSHNNMVPYYGSNVTQNMAVTGVPQAGDNNICEENTDGFSNATPYRGKLEIFTGTDEMWMHKRSTGPMFSPAEQQTGWVFGQPAFRPDMDRYKTSIWKRHGEKPIESVKVGPGLGIDYSTPATGGFHEYTRILPNNVSDYKANQLENKINGGKWMNEHPTSQYINGVNNNKPTLEITQARRPTMPIKSVTNAPSGATNGITNYTTQTLQGKQARTDTEQAAGFGQFDLREYIYDSSGNLVPDNSKGLPCVDYSSAPVGMTMGSQVPQNSQARTSYNNVRETFRRGDWTCLDKTQGQEDWGIVMGPATGASLQGPRDGIYVNYTDRGDVNPFVINVTGTASGGQTWSPNSYQQPARVTTKETTQYSNTGNLSGRDKSYVNTWSDAPRVTVKETTQYSNTGNLTGMDKSYINTWSDNPRVTRKETTQFSHSGNAQKQSSGFVNRDMFDGGTIVP